MAYKIVFLNFFKKHTGKYLWQSLVFDEVAGWKVSQNSQENTCDGASLLIKLQAKPFFKTHKKTPACDRASFLIKLQAEVSKNHKKNTCNWN